MKKISEFYPHLKITNEKFPRLLATRKIVDDKAEYFGAFLTSTAVRIAFYKLIEIFKLRGCTIRIDGNFPLPCHQFFTKKCLAPCVAKICSPEDYAENVEALRLFLKNDFEEFEKFVVGKIDLLSREFEFEKAARWRDLRRDAQNLKADKNAEIRLDDAADTYSYSETELLRIVNLITTRGRKFLGGKEFVFEKDKFFSTEAAFEFILKEFYKFHAPKEIRLPVETANRKEAEKNFRAKLNPKTKIGIIKNELNLTARFRFKRAEMESFLEKIDAGVNAEESGKTFKRIFEMKRKPNKIEVFDVAHLANEDFVAASAVWEKGEFEKEKAGFWKVDADSEPQAMAQAVLQRLMKKDLPDLILVDGAKSQINAVVRILEENNLPQICVGGVVKPLGKHNSVSHFLARQGRKTDFVEGDKILEILRRLRDQAHQTANELHRQYRDNKHIFAVRAADSAVAEEIPLVIVRYDEPGGAAEDLQPLKTPRANDKKNLTR